MLGISRVVSANWLLSKKGISEDFSWQFEAVPEFTCCLSLTSLLLPTIHLPPLPLALDNLILDVKCLALLLDNLVHDQQFRHASELLRILAQRELEIVDFDLVTV